LEGGGDEIKFSNLSKASNSSNIKSGCGSALNNAICINDFIKARYRRQRAVFVKSLTQRTEKPFVLLLLFLFALALL